MTIIIPQMLFSANNNKPPLTYDELCEIENSYIEFKKQFAESKKVEDTEDTSLDIFLDECKKSSEK